MLGVKENKTFALCFSREKYVSGRATFCTQSETDMEASDATTVVLTLAGSGCLRN